MYKHEEYREVSAGRGSGPPAACDDGGVPPDRQVERGENMGELPFFVLPAAAAAHQRQAGDDGGALPDRQARCGSRGRRAHVFGRPRGQRDRTA